VPAAAATDRRCRCRADHERDGVQNGGTGQAERSFKIILVRLVESPPDETLLVLPERKLAGE
jgi:hypothetical protein